MHNILKTGLLNLALPMLAILLVSGCGSINRNIDVSTDDKVKNCSIEVDLVAVNKEGFTVLNTYSMSKYWRPGDSLRKDLNKKVLYFGPGHKNPQKVSRNDPIWDKWEKEGCESLFILADLPGAFKDKTGDADSRRKIIKLTRTFWNKTIYINVKSGSVSCYTKEDD